MALGDFFSELSAFGLGKAAEAGQSSAARIAFEVFKKTKFGKHCPATEWEDLTQREQQDWIGAAGDIFDEKTR